MGWWLRYTLAFLSLSLFPFLGGGIGGKEDNGLRECISPAGWMLGERKEGKKRDKKTSVKTKSAKLKNGGVRY